MGFVEAVKTCFSKAVTFEGRASRSEYWWFWLFGVLISIPNVVVFAVLMAKGYAGFAILLSIVLYGWMWLASLSALVRRLHDTGRSGWWFWISFIPFGFIVLLIFTLTGSAPGENLYGPNPNEESGSRRSSSPRPSGSSSREEHRAPRENGKPAYGNSSAETREPKPSSPYTASSEEETQMMSSAISGKPARLVCDGVEYLLSEGINIVGRKSELSTASVQIVTDDRYMSRRHSSIKISTMPDGTQKALISNAENKNRTFINGQELSGNDILTLSDGDEIKMGHTTLIYKV